jgi:hypothetical protein
MVRTFCALFIVLAFSVFAGAQSKVKLDQPETKTIPSYTAWIREALDKFSFNERDLGWTVESIEISDIQFINCAVKLKVSKHRRRSDPPVRFGQQTPSNPPVSFYTYYVFDFGQLDEKMIVLRPSLIKRMTDIRMSAEALKPIIHFVSDPNTRGEDSGTTSRIVLTVQSRVSEKIGDGIRTLIGLCKETKTS